MHILIDTSPLKNQSAYRGIGRYTRELLQSLQALPTSHTFFSSDQSPQSIDLIHYPFFDFFFHTLPIFKKKKTIVTIHDVIPLLFPNQYVPGIKGSIRLVLQRLALRSVAHIITDSAVSKRDIIDHLKISGDKISVVPLAAADDIVRPPQAVLDVVRKQYKLPKNFLLYVGDINYNKNLPFLIGVMKKFPTLSLVLVGKAMNMTSIPEAQAIQDAIESNELGARVLRFDTVNGIDELCAFYSLATAYIQPSLYEGFGLPVLEAFRCKTLVICSKAGSLPEVAGPAAVYFHPMDPEDCAQAIQKVLSYSQKQKASQIKRGLDQAAMFSWKQVAIQTLSIYESVGGKS